MRFSNYFVLSIELHTVAPVCLIASQPLGQFWMQVSNRHMSLVLTYYVVLCVYMQT